jgi:hypothetical protein
MDFLLEDSTIESVFAAEGFQLTVSQLEEPALRKMQR